MNKCEICDKESKNPRFCSRRCSAIFKVNQEYEKYIADWKSGLIDGGRGTMNGYGAISQHIRKYLFDKYKNQCALCGWSETNVHTNTIPLEVEHIDGNSMSHLESNLILLCPNCHSLTRGHSTSKGNGRRYYRQKYHKEKIVG